MSLGDANAYWTSVASYGAGYSAAMGESMSDVATALYGAGYSAAMGQSMSDVAAALGNQTASGVAPGSQTDATSELAQPPSQAAADDGASSVGPAAVAAAPGSPAPYASMSATAVVIDEMTSSFDIRDGGNAALTQSVVTQYMQFMLAQSIANTITQLFQSIFSTR